MKKRYIYTIICLFFSFCQLTLAEKIDGVFPIYHEAGKVLMEIPRHWNGREVEISGQIDEGFGMISRPVQSLGVVALSIPDSKTVVFHQPFYAERILDKKSPLREAFQVSNEPTVGDVYHAVVVSKEGNPIIDISDVVKGEKEWISSSQYGQIRSLLPDMCKLVDAHAVQSKLGSSVSDGMVLSFLRYHEAESEQYAFNSLAMLLPTGSKPVSLSICFRLLPKEDMPIRLAVRDLPLQTICFKDYSQNPYTVVDDSLVIRLNPNTSSIVYVDNRVPSQYFDALKQGVESWNVLLEKAKMKKKLVVKRAPIGVNTAELPLLIAYDMGEKGVSSQKIVHPRTGEILFGRLNIGHDFQNPIKAEDLQKQVFREFANILGLRLGAKETDVIHALSYLYRPQKRNANVYQDRTVVATIGKGN